MLPVLNDSFDRIAGMLDRFASHRAQEKLKVGVVGTFATGVLFSQLADFRRCYPHIDLHLSTHNNRVDPAADRLEGEAWLQFLDGRRGQAFSQGPGRLVLDGGYRRDVPPAELAAATAVARARFLELMEGRR